MGFIGSSCPLCLEEVRLVWVYYICVYLVYLYMYLLNVNEHVKLLPRAALTYICRVGRKDVSYCHFQPYAQSYRSEPMRVTINRLIARRAFTAWSRKTLIKRSGVLRGEMHLIN